MEEILVAVAAQLAVVLLDLAFRWVRQRMAGGVHAGAVVVA